jgi:hypothetical protein
MSSPGDCSDISERTPGEELIHVIFACPSTNETLISTGCCDKSVEPFRYSSIVNIQSHAQVLFLFCFFIICSQN